MDDDRPQRRSLLRRAADEVAHLRDVADRGESNATPVVLWSAALLVLIPLVALVITLAFTVAHFA